MIVCGRCAQQNPDAAVLCSRCGAELPRPQLTVPGAPLDGGAPVPHMTPTTVGDRLAPGDMVDGKYEIERVLGEGGMGIVYLARDVNTDTKVVVKAMRPAFAHSEEFRARVRQEARSLARIDHPNVVRLNAVVANEGALLLVMQFVDGQSLDHLIAANVAMRTPMPVEEAIGIFRQIVLGVAAAHREGVLHRDIKPANVLVRAKDGVAKVTDFGIAKAEEDAKAGRGQTKGIIGSLSYMAPEQVTGQRDLDKRVDVYALGIVLFEMLMGSVPFDGASEYETMKAITQAPVPSVHAARGDVPAAVDHVIERATAKDRAHRLSSCEELLSALDAALAEAHGPPPSVAWRPAPHASAPPPSMAMAPSSVTHTTEAPSTSRGPLIALAIVAVLGLAGGAGYLALRSDAAQAPQTPTTPTTPTTRTTTITPTAARSSPTVAPVTDPLSGLGGRWVSDTGRHYDAVTSGGSLEFRVRDPAEFPGQNYLAGEARFTLRSAGGALSVEDKIRPTPPVGKTYDVRSRGTCQEVWTEVKGAPLHAAFDGTRLSIELVKITPDKSAFDIEGNKVVGCQRLAASNADRVESTLSRE